MMQAAQRLRAVLKTLKDLELSRLATASRKKTELSNEIAALRLDKIKCQHRALHGGALTPSSLVGADRYWADWTAAQIEVKTIVLAQHAAEREQLVAVALRALGRAAALDAVLSKRKKRGPRP